MVYMMKNKDKILEDIRLIKKIIEDSSIPLQLQFDCVDAMQRILNITDKQPEFSNDESDAIYRAMDDYKCYGDEETEIAESVQEKLWLLNKTFYPFARLVCLCPRWPFYSTLLWWFYDY